MRVSFWWTLLFVLFIFLGIVGILGAIGTVVAMAVSGDWRWIHSMPLSIVLVVAGTLGARATLRELVKGDL